MAGVKGHLYSCLLHHGVKNINYFETSPSFIARGYSTLGTPSLTNTLPTPHISTSGQQSHSTNNGMAAARTSSSTSLSHQNRSAPVESEGALYRAEVNVQERGRGGEETKGRRLAVAITSPSQASRRVNVVVTDPADHFFYYSLNLPEEDFPALRAHQGLLVDFLSFPGMLTQVPFTF